MIHLKKRECLLKIMKIKHVQVICLTQKNVNKQCAFSIVLFSVFRWKDGKRLLTFANCENTRERCKPKCINIFIFINQLFAKAIISC